LKQEQKIVAVGAASGVVAMLLGVCGDCRNRPWSMRAVGGTTTAAWTVVDRT